MRSKDAELDQSIQCIQTFLRAQASKKCTINLSLERCAIPENLQTNYPALFAGNGPINFEIPADKQMKKPFIFVGVSCFYLFKLILNLCHNQQFELLKQIFVLDNSKNVVGFWRYIQRQFIRSSDYKTLLQNLRGCESEWVVFCNQNKDKTHEGIFPFVKGYEPFVYSSTQYNVRQLYSLLEQLCQCVGFDLLKHWVIGAQVIPCDWSDQSTPVFQMIRNIADAEQLEIAVYASNIFAFVDEYDQKDRRGFKKVFHAVTQLKPKLSIYSDVKFGLADLFGDVLKTILMPSKLFCFDGAGPEDQLLNRLGWHRAKQIYDGALEKRQVMVSYFYASVSCMAKGDFAGMLSHIEQGYRMIDEFSAASSLIDGYIRDYFFGRVLGIAHMKAGNADRGVALLNKSLQCLQYFYGPGEFVEKYQAEVNQLVAIHEADKQLVM